MDALSLWLRLERGTRVALSLQLVEQLRERILSGDLLPHQPMPSSRALATDLGISRSVVVRAYEQLNGEGYLEADPGAVTRVAAGIVSTAPSSPQTRAAAPPTRTTSSSPAPSIDLRSGFPFAPTAVPEEWKRALASAGREPLRSYASDALGEPALREQIALHAQRSRGIRCSPEDVIVTSGTAEALLLIALAIGEGARWLVEDPGYPEAVRVLQTTGATVQPVAVDEHGMRAEQLTRYTAEQHFATAQQHRATAEQHRATAVLVTPSHQFPLGGRMPAAERTALIDWAANTGALIVEDDYDSEFRHVGSALPAIAALDPGGVVAHIGSLNKSFTPLLRCGYVIARAGSSAWCAMTEVKRALGSNVSYSTQIATASFFASGGFRRYIARTIREYRRRRALVLECFEAPHLQAGLSGLDGGLHAVLSLPGSLTGADVVEQLAAVGVIVESVAQFSQLERADDSLVIGYGAETLPRLRRGLFEIARAVTPSGHAAR